MRRAALDLWRNAKYREERYAAIALTDLRRYEFASNTQRFRAAFPRSRCHANI